MTFGAMAAWQAWLLLAAAAALAAWLFLLKVRAPRVLVPSLLLWRRVLDESREPTLWERVRRAVSLGVSVALALLLALAVTRPSRAAGTVTGGRTLIVLDSSWSMLARTATGETRWARAIAEAGRLAAGSSGRDVALATTADGLVEGPTTDLALIETALDRLAPSGEAGAAWPRLGAVDAVHFITDGAIARPLDPDVVTHSVFEPAPNVAITAFEVRSPVAGALTGEAYLEVANYSSAAQQIRVTLARGTLGSDLDFRADQSAATRELARQLAAGEVLRQVVPLAADSAPALRARIEAPENALAIDDTAFAWLGSAEPVRVHVVGQQTAWLRTLLERDSHVRATFAAPSADAGGPADADVIVFDRWAPHEPPGRPALYFSPRNAAWLGSGQVEERLPQWHSVGDHPVTRGVDPFTLTIDRARAYTLPDLVPVARSSRGTPLVSVAASDTRRLVLCAFGPDDSNLTSAPAFPVLIVNAIDWLAHPVAGTALRTGLASFDDEIARITGPQGTAVRVAHIEGTSLAALAAPGFYLAEGGGSRSTLAVNIADPQVSNVSRTGLTQSDRGVASGVAGRPLWMYCIAAAFVLALAEWWTWQRRITV